MHGSSGMRLKLPGIMGELLEPTRKVGSMSMMRSIRQWPELKLGKTRRASAARDLWLDSFAGEGLLDKEKLKDKEAWLGMAINNGRTWMPMAACSRTPTTFSAFTAR